MVLHKCFVDDVPVSIFFRKPSLKLRLANQMSCNFKNPNLSLLPVKNVMLGVMPGVMPGGVRWIQGVTAHAESMLTINVTGGTNQHYILFKYPSLSNLD